ncbi:hypothetical protein GCM10022409_21620 [Hymenobacter glaciei]|uniref:DUF4352 domain-containing protein n=1 Tax=Hymenobacter glaciei TaxID=877209 RepID=A0ABP7U5K1_9BACT
MLLSLAGCGQKSTDETATAATAPTPAAETGVVRTESAPAASAPAATPAKAALDTQPGPKGTQVALTKAIVRGDILTMELQYSLPPDGAGITPIYTPLDQINYVDDATSKKYALLKDQTGTFMAVPLYGANKKELRVSVDKGAPGIATFKFPAPPATSQTVSLVVPGVGSFDGIAVQR